MSGKHIAFGVAALVTVASAHAGSSEMTPGKWTHETRSLGNKVTIDVYQREPYALTGSRRDRDARTAPGPWIRETRPLGNKVTIDVYRR